VKELRWVPLPGTDVIPSLGKGDRHPQHLPDAEQCLSYAVPGFKVGGTTIAGFAAFKNHLSYLPHSGSVFPQLADELAGYQKSTGALRFPIDQPLPRELVEKLIAVRLRQSRR